MEVWQVAAILWGSMLFLIICGVPVAFAIGGAAIGGCFLVWGGPEGLIVFSETALYVMGSAPLAAIPLFMVMAELLRHSGVAGDLYITAERWAGRLPGGLGTGTLLMAAVLGAMLGVSPASCAIMSSVSMKPMLERSYDKGLVVGLIGAGAAVGVIIPPSVPMIIYACMTGESVGRMFAAGICVGVSIILLMIAYVAIRCTLQPQMGPRAAEKYGWKDRLVSLRGMIFPLVLIVMVLGSIYAGVCTATEAAGMGAFGALAIVAGRRRLTRDVIKRSILETARVTCMVLWIAIGAIAFSRVVQMAGVSHWMTEIIAGLPVAKGVILITMMLILFGLGFVLDPIGIIMITTPVFIPVVITLGIDTLWFALLYMVILNTSFLTPPFGFNLFVLKGVVPPEVSTLDIYRGVVPFVIIQLLGAAIIIMFPVIVSWFPNLLYGPPLY